MQLFENLQQTITSKTNTDLLIMYSEALVTVVIPTFAYKVVQKNRKLQQLLMKWLLKLKYKKNGKKRKFKFGLFLLSLFIIALTIILAMAIGGLWGIVLGIVVLPLGLLTLSLSFSKK